MATSVLDRKYTWKPSPHDVRDLRLDFGSVRIDELPDTVDLREPFGTASRSFLSAVVDQLNLGSCTANMAAGAVAFSLAAGHSIFGYAASRLFIYYNERVAEGTVNSDSGATITGSAKALAAFGAPAETDWPYDVSRYTEKPPVQAFTDGAEHKAIKYARVPHDASSIRGCLAAGAPICFGFTVYQSFESSDTAQTGVVTMPTAGEGTLGGHATLIVGYLTSAQLVARLQSQGKDTSKIIPGIVYYIVRNSWGTGWGDAGYFYMPEAYVLSSLCSDFWVIQTVDTPDPTPTPPQPAPVPTPTPTPTPSPTPGAAPFPGATVAVAARITTAASRAHLSESDWLNHHFDSYFKLS